MVDQASDWLSAAPESNSFPLSGVLSEIDRYRKADSRTAPGAWNPLETNWTDSKPQGDTVELANPFGDRAEEPSAGKPADSFPEAKTDRPESRFDNSNMMQALAASMETGLPLVVAVGESWCPHCQHMEEKVWPRIEGSPGKPGTMQGKAIFLHLDYDQSESLQGEAGRIAESFRQGVEGFPTLRIYNVSADAKISFKEQAVGEMNQARLEKFLKSGGVK